MNIKTRKGFESDDVTRAAVQAVLVRIGDDLCDLFRLCGSLVGRPASEAARQANDVAKASKANVAAGVPQIGPLALTVSEAATMLSLSRSSLYEMINKREIGIVRLGRRSVRVPRSELDRLLAKSLAQID
jgi:excisionase family DNA binding protein